MVGEGEKRNIDKPRIISKTGVTEKTLETVEKFYQRRYKVAE